jgi:hypothetical protein
MDSGAVYTELSKDVVHVKGTVTSATPFLGGFARQIQAVDVIFFCTRTE